MNAMKEVIQASCAVHPERVALQPCGRCGTFACEQCLGGSLPEEILCAACVAHEGALLLPWDRRQEVGILRAWLRSAIPLMLHPRVTLSRIARREGDVAGSMLFAAIASFFGFFTSFLLFTIVTAVVALPAMEARGYGRDGARAVAVYGSLTVLSPFLGLVATLFMAVIDHLILRLIGKPRSLDITLRGAALSQAPLALGLVPFCSFFITLHWVLVTKVFAYKGLHRTSTGVAVASALLTPMLFLGGYLLFLARVMGFIGR